MNPKIVARNLVQGILERVPKQFHRYLLSCYQQRPGTFLGTGYEVLCNLKDQSAESQESSLYYLKNFQPIQSICNEISSCVILDVGANIGQTALAYEKIFYGASIHSFEPFKENFEHLAINTKAFPNITPHHIALSDRSGRLELKRDQHPLSQWNSISMAYQDHLESVGNFQVETIEMTTGDEFCEKQNLQNIALLKIDTEGHELDVLKGFAGIISQGQILSILVELGFFEDSTHGSFQSVNQFMLDHGMVLCGFHDPDYHPDGRTNFVNAFYRRSPAG